MKIHNSHILITGSNRGIGLALAKAAALRKAHLHLVVRQEDKHIVQELLNLGASSVQVWIADLQNPQSVEELTNKLKTLPIDILINNAGLLTGGLLETQTKEEIAHMFQVNVVSLVELTRALLPNMIKRKNGKIVNNASVSALMHFPGASTYAASKAAVWAFTNCLNIELSGTGVSTLTLITPGVKTRMFDDIEKKYGTFLEVPQDHIPADVFADQVMSAIESDQDFLYPTIGLTRFGLWISQLLPKVFKGAVRSKFNRNSA